MAFLLDERAELNEQLYVSGRRVRAPSGRHHRGFVGHKSIAGNHQQSEQEGLRADRGLAEPASGGGKTPEDGIERLNREIRRRTNAVGTFPDGSSALMPVCARLRHVSATDWGTKTYLNMKHLYELERDQAESNQTVNA